MPTVNEPPAHASVFICQHLWNWMCTYFLKMKLIYYYTAISCTVLWWSFSTSVLCLSAILTVLMILGFICAVHSKHVLDHFLSFTPSIDIYIWHLVTKLYFKFSQITDGFTFSFIRNFIIIHCSILEFTSTSLILGKRTTVHICRWTTQGD